LPRWRPGSVRRTWATASGRSWNVLLDPSSFWQAFGTWDGEPIRFDDWQVVHLWDHARLRAREKAPQIGFSWVSALEALHTALIFDGETSAFISVDLREASEKILYAKKAYFELVEAFPWIGRWVPMVKETSDELWFGSEHSPSRLMSLPHTAAMRGRKMSLYLDEADFYKDAGAAAWRIGFGRIQRGGRVTIGSTCFGQDTALDRVMSQEDQEAKGDVSRGRFPESVVQNEQEREVIEIARRQLDPEDFEEEYRCIRGAASATFSPDLLRSAQHELTMIEPEDLEPHEGQVGAFDVGASQHPSILSVFERRGDVWSQRVLHELRGKSLPDQVRFLRELLSRLDTLTLVIDAQGIGLGPAQSLEEEFPRRVVLMKAGSKPERMEPMDKVEMATATRHGLEKGDLKIAPEREQAKQFRRTRIVHGKVDQPGSRKKTHYDRFWTVAYAWYGVRNARRRRSIYEERGLIVVGGDRDALALP
jgi:phage FluMu gp28-like protein